MTALHFSGNGQTLPGKVHDSASRQPLPFVTVHLMKLDRTPVKTVVSDSTGGFMITVDTGKYFLLYTCAGYHPFASGEILVQQEKNELAPVFMKRDSGQLAAVTVYGRRPVIEPAADGFVYNADNDIAIAAGTAVDVLRRIPMLTITPEGTPSIRGSTNVRVFIDNRPSNVFASSVAEALQQVPSEEIFKVEVITHPSSKYDAEGTDAVINIITKKRKYDGYNGNLRGNLGNWQQDIATTLKLRSGYWILNIDGSINRNAYEGGYKLTRSANRLETDNRFQQEREWESHNNTQLIGVNVVRILDSLNTINLGYRYRAAAGKELPVLLTQVFTADTVSNAFTRETPASNYNNVHTGTASYSGQSRNKQHEYSVLAFYFGHTGGDRYDLRQLRKQTVDYREKSEGKSANRELTVQADFTKHFSKLSKLETGIKANWRTTESQNFIDIYNFSQDKYLRDNVRTNNFRYLRDVYGAYAIYSLSVKKWQWRAGIRYEETRLNTSFKDTAIQIPNLSNLLPNFLARYTIDEKSSLAYSYNSQILRPYTFYLNPNINYADSFNISFGNPNLLPEVTHNHTIDYNFNQRSLFAGVSLQYARVRKIIEEIRQLRPDNVSETSWRNGANGTNWTLSTTIRYNRNNKFNVGATINVQHITRTSPALNLTTSGIISQYNINLSYRLKKGWGLESYIYYTTGQIQLQYTRTGYLFYNLLVTKKLLNDKLNIVLRMDGFLNEWFYRTNEINTATLFQAQEFRSINRYLRLAISWRFGKQDLRTPVTRNAESND